jgi:hypothetical protein
LPTTSRDALPTEVPAYIVPQEALATLAPKLNRLESEFEERVIGDRSVQEAYRAEVASLLGDVGQSILKYVDGRLRQAPHWALVRGLPSELAQTLLVGLTAALGDLCSAASEEALREIRPATDIRTPATGILNEFLHTDSPNWPNPNDLTCLFCVRPDQFGGGATRILSIENLFSALQRSHCGADALCFLQNTKVLWQAGPGFGMQIFEDFVFHDSKLRWLRMVIQEAIGGHLEKTLRAALDEVERTIEGGSTCERFFMQSGDLLILDNRRCLHARTSTPFEEQSQRLVLRTKIRLHQTGSPGP